MRERFQKFLDRLESRLALYLTLGGSSVMGVIGGWLSAYSEWIAQFGAFGYFMSGLVAAAISMIVAGIGYLIRFYAVKIAYFKQASRPTNLINPLSNSFDRVRIRVADLPQPGFRLVEGKTFVDCELVGPESIILSGCDLGVFKGGFCDFMVIRDRGPRPENIIVFRNCTFVRCKFFLLVIMMNQGTATDLHQMSNGQIPWLTPVGPDVAIQESRTAPQSPQDVEQETQQ
jgi:hypothetical protein